MRALIVLASLFACKQGAVKLDESAAPADTGETSTPDSPPPDSGETGGPADSHDSAPVETGDPVEPALACDLVSDLEDPWFLEGDTVSFTVSCTGDLATEDAEISALSLPGGASFDTGSRTLTWATGPADGGRADAVFTVRARDGGGVPSAETITFWVADDPTASDNVAVDPATYQEEWGLPVMHVEVPTRLNSAYVDATVTFHGVELPASIKIRGASSSYYPKPGYTLEFNGDELEIPEWGAHRNHLILLTTFDDNSYVRQKLVYDLWAEMADHWDMDRLTPRTFFVVVYLNGSYHGLYVGLDRIDDEYLDHMGFERDANLYKAVNHNANFYLTDVYGGTKTTLDDGYTKEEGDPESDTTDLQELVAFTGGSSVSELLAGSGDWFDLQEFMDWFLLVNYTLSEDSGGKNSYLYHSQSGGQFRYSPWDFNHSWGQGWYTYRIDAEYDDTFTWANRVFYAIQSDADASAELWERFAAMRADGGPLSLEWQTAKLDAYYALIQPSAERDWAKWESRYESYSSWASTRTSAGDWQDYEGEKDYLYQWVEDRAAYFEELHP